MSRDRVRSASEVNGNSIAINAYSNDLFYDVLYECIRKRGNEIEQKFLTLLGYSQLVIVLLS